MYKNRITKILNIEHPIANIGNCMMKLSSPDFIAAISKTGALGILSSTIYSTQIKFREAIHETKTLTDRPFGVYLNPTVFFPQKHYLEVTIDENIPVVVTSGNKPKELYSQLKAAGVTVIHFCNNTEQAIQAQDNGADIVVLLFVLVPESSKKIDTPILSQSANEDKSVLQNALTLGADGVALNHGLLATKECPLHPKLKQALSVAPKGLGGLYGKLVATFQNILAQKDPATIKIADFDKFNMWNKALVENIDTPLVSYNQNNDLINNFRTVAEVIGEIVRTTKS